MSRAERYHVFTHRDDETVECPACEGIGDYVVDDGTCPLCDGSGELTAKRLFEIAALISELGDYREFEVSPNGKVGES